MILDFSFLANHMSVCQCACDHCPIAWLNAWLWPSFICSTDDFMFVSRIFWYKVEFYHRLQVCFGCKKPKSSYFKIGMRCLSWCDFSFNMVHCIIKKHHHLDLTILKDFVSDRLCFLHIPKSCSYILFEEKELFPSYPTIPTNRKKFSGRMVQQNAVYLKTSCHGIYMKPWNKTLFISRWSSDHEILQSTKPEQQKKNSHCLHKFRLS